MTAEQDKASTLIQQSEHLIRSSDADTYMSGDHVHHRLSWHGTGRDRQQPTAVCGQDCGQRSSRGSWPQEVRRHRRLTGSATLHLGAAARAGVHLGAPSAEPTDAFMVCCCPGVRGIADEAAAPRWSPALPRVPRPGCIRVDGFVGRCNVAGVVCEVVEVEGIV